MQKIHIHFWYFYFLLAFIPNAVHPLLAESKFRSSVPFFSIKDPKGTSSTIQLTETKRPPMGQEPKAHSSNQNHLIQKEQIHGKGQPEGEVDYILGGGDVLKIQVYDEPDLSMDQIRVSIDGFINFPLIGKVKVKGFNTSKLESKIQNLLRDGYLRNPQVSILVEEYASRKVFILGAVRQPGSYQLKGQATLLEMMSRAGGINDQAAQRFMILRSINGEAQQFVIDRKKLIDDGDLSLNKRIYNNDTIYVPVGDVIFVFGEVEKPGPYQMTKLNRTVLSAISQAGGFTKIGVPKKTRIVRVSDGEVQTIYVNVEDILKKGDKDKDIELVAEDVIIVPESLF